MVEVELEDWQKELFNSYKTKARSTNPLETYYNRWNAKVCSSEFATESNPYNFLDNPEAVELISCARENLEESILFLSDKIFASSDPNDVAKSLAPILFCEIAKNKYGNLIEELKEDWKVNSYTRSGSYIYPSPEMLTKEYIKSILNKDFAAGRITKSASRPNVNNEFEDNDNIISVAPNPVSSSSFIKIEVSEKSSVQLKVINGSGTVSELLVSKKMLDKGIYTYPINVNRLTTGINICTLEVNDKIYTRKILKQ